MRRSNKIPKSSLLEFMASGYFRNMHVKSKTLKENNMADEAKEMYERITSSGSYDEALCIISEYVEITSIDEYEEETEEMGMEMM